MATKIGASLYVVGFKDKIKDELNDYLSVRSVAVSSIKLEKARCSEDNLHYLHIEIGQDNFDKKIIDAGLNAINHGNFQIYSFSWYE